MSRDCLWKQSFPRQTVVHVYDMYDELINDMNDPMSIGSILGELFPDGSAIDRLRRNRLVLWHQGVERIESSLIYKGKTYDAAPLGADFEELLRLPDRTQDFGSIGDLITGLSERIATYVSLDETTKLLLASFVLSTWVVE